MSTINEISSDNFPRASPSSPDMEPPPLPPPVRLPKFPPNKSPNGQAPGMITDQGVVDLREDTADSRSHASDIVDSRSHAPDAVYIRGRAPDIPKAEKPLPAPRTKLQTRPSSDHEIISRSKSSPEMVTDLDKPPEEEQGYLSSHHLPASLDSQSPLNRETPDFSPSRDHSPSPDVSHSYDSNSKNRINSDLIGWDSDEGTDSHTPPPYSPPPPPLLSDVPPPLPPRPPPKGSPIGVRETDKPLLPLAPGTLQRPKGDTRNGITTLRHGFLVFRQDRCWCKLKDGKFSVYAERKNPSPKLQFSCVDILEISVDKKNSLAFGFEMNSAKEKNRQFSFLAESSEERNDWLQALAKCICDALAMYATTLKAGCKEFEIAGRMHVRHGTTGRWMRSWIELIGKTLRIFSDDEDDECDLRKVVSINVVNVAFYESKSVAICPNAAENSNPFIINMRGRVLYFQAEIERATTSWMKLLQQRARECGNAIEDQPMTAEDVPVVVQKCIEFVCAHGMKTEGIYRQSGVNSRIASILDIFAKDAHGCHLSREIFSENDVAGALKRFFRDLPESLIRLELYQPFLHCSEIQDVQQKIKKYRSLLEQLAPRPNYVTLKKLLCHLKLVSEFAACNKMSISNIASCFGSTLMSGSMKSDSVEKYTDHDFSGSVKEITVLVDLLTYYEVLFDVKEEELQKERKMIEEVERFHEQKQTPPRAGDLLMGVYWMDRKGVAVNVRIKTTLTAGELCRSLMEREKMQPDPAYALHEVIFDDKLCRPVFDDEEVIPIILRWTQWNEVNICPYSSNYLCVRRNEMHDKIAPLIRSPISVVQQLFFSKDKSFKKRALGFRRMNLTCFKDLLVNDEIGDKNLGVWRIEDVIWFLGCSPNRSPPSKWAFTFIEKNTFLERLKENKTAFGYTVCCDEEVDLIKWISAIVQAQSLMRYSATENGSSV